LEMQQEHVTPTAACGNHALLRFVPASLCRRSAGSALLTTVASVFTQANIELAKAAYEEVAGAWLAEHQPAAAAAAAAAAAPAQPVAQVVYLPSQDDGSGIKLHTNTPVEIRNPVTVDTPVRQDNVQIGGVSSWLGHRRLV
jgi:hypothetical protein